MRRTYIFLILAAIGIALGIWMVVLGRKPVPVAKPLAQPASAPYESFVAGAGIIEAATENIEVGTPTAGIIVEINVQVGDMVKKGEPLFKLDDRNVNAELIVRQAALSQSKARLTRLQELPRPEDVNVAIATVKQSEANLADLQAQLQRFEAVTDPRAITKEDLDRRRYAAEAGKARLEETKARLALLKAGAWQPDIQIAQAEVQAAQAQVQAAQIELDRLMIRAPVAGRILQVKVRLGQFAPAGNTVEPLMLIGNVDQLHVRVDIDENDAWRIEKDVPAVAYVRGNRDIMAQMRFVRLEPYVVPKRSLTGESTERVDTRVLQAIYSFDKGDKPLYVGQLMDVFIKAKPVAGATAADHKK